MIYGILKVHNWGSQSLTHISIFFRELYLFLIKLKLRLAQHNFLFAEGDFNELNINFAREIWIDFNQAKKW